MAGAFDELLATFAEEADRKAFEDLSSKNPKLKESVLLRSDYSRRMDEVKDQLTELNGWKDWRSKHWDEDKKMTKREAEKLAEIERLQTEKQQLEDRLLTIPENKGDDVTFDQLNQWGENFAKQKNILTKPELEKIIGDKEKELQQFVKTQGQFETYAALTTPELNLRHMNEFGEPFKAKEFIKAATDKGQFDLEAFYDSYVQEKRSAKVKSDHEAELKRVQDDAAAKIKDAEEKAAAATQRAANMGPNGLTPTDNDGASMGPMQRKILKMDQVTSEEGKVPDVPLGEGGIAAFAAREFLKKQASPTA